MKKKLLFFLILMSGMVYSSIAQDDYLFNEKKRTASFFINTTALIHPKLSGLLLGGEYQWNSHYGIHQQLGFFSINKEAGNTKRRGIRTSSELRRYFDSFDRTISNSYMGLQLRYWDYKEAGTNGFCRGGADCQTIQSMDYTLRQYALGAGISMGAITHWGKHFFVDFGGTLGGMLRKNKTNLPQDAFRAEKLFSYNLPNPRNFKIYEIYFLCYIKLGYSF